MTKFPNCMWYVFYEKKILRISTCMNMFDLYSFHKQNLIHCCLTTLVKDYEEITSLKNPCLLCIWIVGMGNEKFKTFMLWTCAKRTIW